MATQLTLRKGTKVQNDAFTGAEAELTYDSTSKGLRIHDGSTQGGNKVPVLVAVQYPDANNNYTWYRKWSDGWVEQGGLVESTNTDYQEQTVSLPVEMANERYTVSITPMTGYDNTMQARGYSYYLPTTTNFKVAPQAKQYTWGICWEVKGMAAN